MTITTTEGASKAVLDEILDISSRRNRIFDVVRDLGSAILGESIDLPKQAKPTNTSATTRAAPQSLLPTAESLKVDQEAFYNIAIPQLQNKQLMNGTWSKNTGDAAARHMMNEMDDALALYLAVTAAYDATGLLYQDNIAGDTLTMDDFLLSEANILAQDGILREDLVYVLSSYGHANAKKVLPTYVPGFVGLSGSGQMGIPAIASINGIPVIESNSVVRNRTFVTTAAVTTGTGVTHTYTVAAGHGLMPGQKVTVSGHDADENIATATAITSVTATTVVVTTAATADGTSADTSGLITLPNSMNLLFDRHQVFGARQIMPGIRAVDDYESSGTALQIYRAYGYKAHAGRVRVLSSPGSTI